MYTSHALLLTSALVAQSFAHTYLITPKSRLSFQYDIGTSTASGSGNEKGLCHMGDGSPLCCSSTLMTGSQVTIYKRGDTVEAASWRNNHVGGFVRWSIVPTSKDITQDDFDANVFHQACNQVGCTKTYNGQSPNNWSGGDSDGSSGWSNPCSHKFQIPDWLDDGAYTVQWVWFGQGNGNSANSPFQACMEINISGGSTGNKPSCPLWQGGDLSEKSDVACVYVSVNSPTYQGVCKSANACSGSYQTGVPKGLTACQAGNPPSSWPLGMEASTNVKNTAFQVVSADSSAKNTTSSSSKSSSASASNSTSTSSTSGRKCRAKNSKRRHIAARNQMPRRMSYQVAGSKH